MKSKTITFKKAVEQTEEIKNCYQKGLQAFGNYSTKIELSEPSQCNGSIDIDECVKPKYPQSNRWDYAFSYIGQVYFVEVHSADTSEVSVVLEKLQWLKDWLNTKAPKIKLLQAAKPYYWIQTKGYHIAKNSKQERILAQQGLKPISKLKL